MNVSERSLEASQVFRTVPLARWVEAVLDLFYLRVLTRLMKHVGIKKGNLLQRREDEHWPGKKDLKE